MKQPYVSAADKLSELRAKFLKSSCGERLVKEFGLPHIGTWRVEAEGVDGPGKNYGYFHGSLQDIITMAVQLPGFWGYGPGYISHVKVIQVNAEILATQADLQARKKELERELNEVTNKILY